MKKIRKSIRRYFARLWRVLINKEIVPLTKKEEFYEFLEENRERIQYLMTSGPNSHYTYDNSDIKKMLESKTGNVDENRRKFRNINSKLDKLDLKLDTYLKLLKNSNKKLVNTKN